MLITGLDGFFDELERRSKELGYLTLAKLTGRIEDELGKLDWSDAVEAEEWVHRESVAAADGSESKFRIRAWSPKGLRGLTSRTFRVGAPSTALDDVHSVDLTGQGLADVDTTLATPALRAATALLISAAETSGRLLREHTSENLRIIQELRGRLRDQENHTDKLLRTIEKARADQFNDLANELAETAVELDRKEREIAKRDDSPVSVGMEKLATLGKAVFAAHKGLPPDLVDLLGEADPALLAKLGDKRLRRFLQRREAAGLFDQFLDMLDGEDDVLDGDATTDT